MRPLGETALTCIHNQCFEQTKSEILKDLNEIFNFYVAEKSICI